MTTLPFSKFEGLGNDFILVDGLSRSLPSSITAIDSVRRLCDRRRGVGADGVILVLPPSATSGCQVKMLVINADGSVPQMCGNGIRCVARFLHGQEAGPFSGATRLDIETDAGPRSCEICCAESGAILVRVDMGIARFERSALPMSGTGCFIDGDLEVGGRSWRGTAVSMGNPHWVSFQADHEGLEHLARDIGPLVERHSAFPERTNVEFAHMRGPAEVEVWVWERGVGLTQACGTGACAVVAAAVVTGRASAGQHVRVRLPGGALDICVEDDHPAGGITSLDDASARMRTARVWMTGPASHVFDGRLAGTALSGAEL